MEPEKHSAPDGIAYSLEEFLQHYGREHGRRRWDNAAPPLSAREHTFDADATEHSDAPVGGEQHAALPDSATQDTDWQVEQADTPMDNLVCELQNFLLCVVQDTWRSDTCGSATKQTRSSRVTTDQARSSRDATERASKQRYTITETDIEQLIQENIEDWLCSQNNETFYNEPALVLHQRMWSIMSRNTEGLTKAKKFKEWCRRVHTHSQATSIATEHAESERERNCFKSLAFDLLSNELTRTQRADPKYQISKNTTTGQISITSKQRSWINVMLRNNLGDAKVAYFIFNHGLPELFNTPTRRKALTKEMLQDMLEQFMHWYASLLNSIVEHQSHPDMENARKLASLDYKMWTQQRRERRMEIKRELAQGKRLMEERDSGTKRFDSMSDKEQFVLEDVELGRCAKRLANESYKKLPLFRGKML